VIASSQTLPAIGITAYTALASTADAFTISVSGGVMHRMNRWTYSLIMAAVFILPAIGTTGCAGRVTYGTRVYDPYHRDYHTWNDNEVVIYRQYWVDRHQPYRDYRRLKRNERREYWEWRHRR
jgi:hypothetical protein